MATMLIVCFSFLHFLNCILKSAVSAQSYSHSTIVHQLSCDPRRPAHILGPGCLILFALSPFKIQTTTTCLRKQTQKMLLAKQLHLITMNAFAHKILGDMLVAQ